jgi:RND family efflux transporter MFP subunit
VAIRTIKESRLAALLALAFTASGCSSSTSAAPQESPVAPASHVVQMDMRNTVTLTAEVQPFYEVDVMAKEAGYVRHMLVDIGDHVKAGQLICVLEIPELEDELQRAKADVVTAAAEQSAAEQDQKHAVASEAIAHLSYTRILDVSKREPGLVPLQEVDVAHSRDLEAEALVAAADEKIQAAASRLQAAKADLEHQNALFAYTRIVSPLNGIVTQRYASDGAMIQAGTSSSTQTMPVVHVAQDDVLRLMLPVPEADAGTIRDGQQVQVTVPALHKSFAGKVTRFAGQVQMSTRTMTAEVDVKNALRDLIPGMYAQVELTLADAPHTVAAPIGAIDGAGSAAKVYVIDASGIVHARNVTTGIQNPQFIQIIAGARPGEAVVTGNMSAIQDGEHVQPRFE